MMKNKVMQLVKQICNMGSIDCRSLNKGNLARELMNLANIPSNAEIQEIPIDWNNQVEILFLLPSDKNYYSLFAGIGMDGEFYFKISITGILHDNGYFDFFGEHGEKDQILPIDYFLNQYKGEEIKMNESLLELLEREKAELRHVNFYRECLQKEESCLNRDERSIELWKNDIKQAEKALSDVRKDIKQYLSFLMEL